MILIPRFSLTGSKTVENSFKKKGLMKSVQYKVFVESRALASLSVEEVGTRHDDANRAKDCKSDLTNPIEFACR